VLAVVVAGFCASLGAIVWGGTVAPRLANSQFQRQFRRRSGPAGGHQLGQQVGHQLGEQPGHERGREPGPGHLCVPVQLPEPGSTS
jgi:hypothetical protein